LQKQEGRAAPSRWPEVPARRPPADDRAAHVSFRRNPVDGGAPRHRRASAQSLTEALAEAYRTNPQLLAQRALLRATDEMVPQALANWRPTVAFTGQTGYGVSAESAAAGPRAYSHSTPSSLERPAMPAKREEALTLAARNNPNVISAGLTELAARDNIDVVRGQLLPQVSVIGDLNRAISSATSAGAITPATTTAASITATMTMPL
jgi:outer membrane protein